MPDEKRVNILRRVMQSGLLNPPGEPFRLSVPVLTVSGVILLLVSLQMLWSHSSTTGEFLGRYSMRYAVALLASLMLLGVWTIALFRRQAVSQLIRGLPDRWYTGLVVISGLMVFGILVLPLEDRIQHFAALNWLAGLALTGLLRPDQPASRRWLWVGLPVVLGVWFIPAVISVLTRRAFSPDEAMWADYASSVFRASGMYARTWLQEPVAISPGLGWSVAGYGWLLEHVSFSLLTGRVCNFLGYVAAFVGIGLVTWRLYGLKPALINVAFATLSRAFVPVLDYRPDHQLPAAAMFITFAALQGRLSQRRGIWHFLCGLLATLALQIHAAGVVLAFGFSLFYLVESLPKLRHRQWQAFWPLLWFGIGALIGSLIYYLFNIQPVGGLEVFLNTLVDTRLNTNRRILFLSWPSFFEWMLILSAFIYLIWRRSPADRLFLGILACVLAGVVLLAAAVLEHLKYPERLLRQARALLQPGARVIVSLPNIAYWRLRLMLLAGRFDYTDYGVMDRTHLRLYTARSGRALLEDQGYTVEALHIAGSGAQNALNALARRFNRPLPAPILPGLLAYELIYLARA